MKKLLVLLAASISLAAIAPTVVSASETADLALSDLTVLMSESRVRTFTACNFTIENNGPADLIGEGIEVTFYLSDDTVFGDEDDQEIGETDIEVTIEAGNSGSYTLAEENLGDMVDDWGSSLVEEGDYYVFARVKFHGTSPEDPEPGNNTDRADSIFTYEDTLGADLILDNLEATRSYNSVRSFSDCSFTLTNEGPAALSDVEVTVNFYLSNDKFFGDSDDEKIGRTDMRVTIDVNEAYGITLNRDQLAEMADRWTGSLVSNGSYYLYAEVVMEEDDIEDSISGNNNDRTDLGFDYQKAATEINLELTGLDVDRPVDTTAKTFDACRFRIENQGDSDLTNESVTLSFYLSNDKIYGDDDKKIGEAQITVTVPSGNYQDVNWNGGAELTAMVADWSDDLVSNADYYLFAEISIDSDPSLDPETGDNFDRTGSTFSFEGSSRDDEADLAIEDLAVALSGSSLRTVSACSFTIRNNGPTDLTGENITVTYYLSNDTSFDDHDDEDIGVVDMEITIDSGDAYAVSLDSVALSDITDDWGTGTVSEGDYYVYAVVNIANSSLDDPMDENDYDRTNHAFTYLEDPETDLRLEDLSATLSSVALRSFSTCSFSIENDGPLDLSDEDATVTFYLSDDTTFGDEDDEKIGETRLTLSIAPDDAVSVDLDSNGLSNMVADWTNGLVPEGTYYVYAEIEIDDGLPEDPAFENNYDRTASAISYTETLEADLALQSLTISRSNSSVETFSACTFSILNNGPKDLSETDITVTYYLSDDTTFGDADDAEIGSTPMSLTIYSGYTYGVELTGDQLSDMTSGWTSNLVASGDYYLFAAVGIDGTDLMDPASDNNHDAADSSISYSGSTSEANLYLSGLTATRSDSYLRTFSACSFTIQNDGPADLSEENITVTYYLSDNATFGDSDDEEIGQTHWAVTIGAGEIHPVTLSGSELSDMASEWTNGLVPDGEYYLHAAVMIDDGSPVDTLSSDSHDRIDSTFSYTGETLQADLAMLDLAVTRQDSSSRTFSACSYGIENNGPADLSDERVTVTYYLSENTTFDDSDDEKIGETRMSATIASGSTLAVTLDNDALFDMTADWSAKLVSGGNYFVFASVAIEDGVPEDPASGNDHGRTGSAISYVEPEVADLALSDLSVLRSGSWKRSFFDCGYSLANDGPDDLADEEVIVVYYLSDDTVFGDLDDRKIGETLISASIDAGGVVDVILTDEELSDMTAEWTRSLLPDGSYYLFAQASVADGSPEDPDPDNDVVHTDESFSYTGSEAGGFDHQAYLAANSDLSENGVESYEECVNHYKAFGFHENRATRINLEEYLNANPDLPSNWTTADALNHYNIFGKFENRLLAFDAQEYLSLYPDLPEEWSYDQAYSHYIYFGKQEGRIASFDETAYLEFYADLPLSWDQADAFSHYLTFGREEGRVYDPYDESVFLSEE